LRTGCLIVTYNSAGHLAACVESCLRFGDRFDCGIVVVDNASADSTCDIARGYAPLELIANRTNKGFAAAVNEGFRILSRADAVLLLNPDAVLLDDPRPLIDALGDSSVGAASGLLVDSAGDPQQGFSIRRFPTALTLCFEVLGLNRLWSSNPVNRRYRCLDLDPRGDLDVEQPAGAFLLIRRDAWQAAGGFDEGFHPLWFEDVDFLLRLRRLGWRVRHLGRVRARHAGGHSIAALSWSDRQLYWYDSLLRFVRLHFTGGGRLIVFLAVSAALLPRSIWAVFRLGSVRPVAVYCKLMRSRSAVILAEAPEPHSGGHDMERQARARGS
jgi:hypothetical protein